MIQRRTPIRRKRPGPPRRGQPTNEEKGVLRLAVFERDGGRCVLCRREVQWDAGFLNSMHLMHIKSRGSGGTWEMSNLATGCPECHMKSHNCGGKPLAAPLH